MDADHEPQRRSQAEGRVDMQSNVSVLLIIHAVLAVLLLGGSLTRRLLCALRTVAVTLCSIAYTCNVLLPYATKT